MARTIRHEPRPCPWCSAVNNAATDPVAHDTPSTGDAMLCWQCGQWQIWEPTHMRRPNPVEELEIEADAAASRMLAAWRQLSPTRRKDRDQ